MAGLATREEWEEVRINVAGKLYPVAAIDVSPLGHQESHLIAGPQVCPKTADPPA
jgi:hypothetical protein